MGAHQSDAPGDQHRRPRLSACRDPLGTLSAPAPCPGRRTAFRGRRLPRELPGRIGRTGAKRAAGGGARVAPKCGTAAGGVGRREPCPGKTGSGDGCRPTGPSGAHPCPAAEAARGPHRRFRRKARPVRAPLLCLTSCLFMGLLRLLCGTPADRSCAPDGSPRIVSAKRARRAHTPERASLPWSERHRGLKRFPEVAPQIGPGRGDAPRP